MICRMLTLFLASLVLGINCYEPEVEVPQGRLRGGTRINKDGETYYSFQNIPYGIPPLGELRFLAPQPAEAWNGTRDATQDLPQCLQAGSGFITGQEDCLYLNIYTPELPGENVTEKAVMVFIHGGSFTSGSAMETLYGGKFLLTKDVVLVVINYRLGIFGFLTLDDPDLGVTGNAGLKDQVLALQWVNDNIQYFGGDPNNILLFGQSAGSVSVHMQMLSPLSRGLFHKAIAQSGTAFAPSLALRNTGEVIARELGISTENWGEMLDSLRDVQPELLTLVETILIGTYGNIIAPVVEIPSNEPSFLNETPLDIIRSGNYNQVPLITGVTDAEGLLFQLVSRLTTGESMLITDFTGFIPAELEIEPGSEEEAILSQKIQYFYYGDTEPSRDNITAAVQLWGDFVFSFPAYRAVLEHLQTLSYPIYFYYFTADTALNFMKLLDETTAVFPGAAHSDELGYMLDNFFLTTDIPEGSVEEIALRRMVDLWTNFAIYGNPTPEINNGLKWEPVTANQFNYLHADTEEFSMEVDPIPEFLQFWSGIFEELLPRK